MLLYVLMIGCVCLLLLAVARRRYAALKDQDDFMVAGRALRWPVLAFTLLSSWIGAGSLFVGGENAFHHGFSALWLPAGGWAGLFVVMAIAPRARRLAIYTVPEMLEVRFNSATRVLATVAILLAYTGIASYQFRGGGDLLHLILPSLPAVAGMWLVAAFAIILAALAGMSSVVYVDLAIGIVVIVSVLLGFPLLLGTAGGWSHVRAALPSAHFTPMGCLTVQRALGFFLPMMLLLLGNQSMYQKLSAARSERDARTGVIVWIAGTIVVETTLVATSVVGSALYPDAIPHDIIPVTARRGLPVFPGAVLLAAIFAKVVSTGNNYLFSPAMNLVHDCYRRFADPCAGERKMILLSRLAVVSLGICAVSLQTLQPSILAVALFAYTVYGAAITPTLLAGFFWRRANGAGALSSIAAGIITTLVWTATARLADPLAPADPLQTIARFASGIEAIYPALLSSIISLVVISLATAPPRGYQWRAFFEPPFPGGSGQRRLMAGGCGRFERKHSLPDARNEKPPSQETSK